MSRALALTADAALVLVLFLLGLASLALVGSLVGRPPRVVEVVGTAALWSIVVAVYFVFFWTTTGQTPGLRFLRLRVLTVRRQPPSVPRALLRLLALGLSIVFLLLGFVPALYDRRRRALPDFVAGTVVARDPIIRSG